VAKQERVGRVEQRSDLLISKAMGGDPHSVAEFPNRAAIELSGLPAAVG
jgi:hypothetical protein